MLFELFSFFLKLGTFTVGGGVAMIPIIRDSLVRDKKWFSDEEMADMIAICQSLPGVIAINMATFVGFKKKGFLGSLVSTIGVLLPSFIVILLIAQGINVIGDMAIVQGALAGLRAASAGLIVVAVWQVASMAIGDWISAALAVLSFVLISFLEVPVSYVVIGFLICGVISAHIRLKYAQNDVDDIEKEDENK